MCSSCMQTLAFNMLVGASAVVHASVWVHASTWVIQEHASVWRKPVHGCMKVCGWVQAYVEGRGQSLVLFFTFVSLFETWSLGL